MQRLEVKDGKSSKFWEIERKGASLLIRFGRIGTDGQVLTKSFPTADAAQREHDKLVTQKKKKGNEDAPKAAPPSVRAPSTAAAPKPPKRRIGRVINGYSNYLAILVADADVAAAYSGPVNDPVDEDGRKKKQKRPPPDDFERAIAALNKTEAFGAGRGVVVEIGGCGVAEVHRFGEVLVIPETYQDEDDADAEAALDRAIAAHPATKPKRLGSVEVKSGVLVMMGLWEAGPKLTAAQVTKRGVVETMSGIAVAVPPGTYEVWREQFAKEPKGAWGSMPSRVRVVPAGTPVESGARLLDAAPVTSQRARV